MTEKHELLENENKEQKDNVFYIYKMINFIEKPFFHIFLTFNKS